MNSFLLHDGQNVEGAAKVVLVVLDRFDCGFPYRFITCEMDDRVDVIFFKNPYSFRIFCAINLVELRSNVGDFLNAVKDGDLGIIEVIKDDWLVSAFDELDDGFAANESKSSGD